jgi:hypothetical protein
MGAGVMRDQGEPGEGSGVVDAMGMEGANGLFWCCCSPWTDTGGSLGVTRAGLEVPAWQLFALVAPL